ncbi:hypothetical protein GCM10010214_11060 [Streptomyces abikoensis]|nr:hypothetical protein GCM10010214_11060 [Streptomyces abikoensis]
MSKRTPSKRGGGTISATRRSAGTCGAREVSATGVPDGPPVIGPGAAGAVALAGDAVEDDTAVQRSP